VAALAAFFVVAVTAGGADTFTVRLVSQTNSTITLGWDPQPGYGYLFSAGGTLVSRTNDASRSSVKFSKVRSGQYDIDVIAKGATGHYPAAAPPPQDTTPPTVSMTGPANGSTVSGVIAVAAIAADNVGVTRVDFFRDGVALGSDTSSPYAVNFDTTTVANGTYTFGARAFDAAGNSTPANQTTANVSNNTPPPPPPGGTVFLSPSGNDTNPCSQAFPCRSFQRGYEAAQPGQVVELAAGAYGAQAMRRQASKTSPDDVVLRPAAGAQVTVTALSLGSIDVPNSGPEHLTIQDVKDARSPQGEVVVVGVNDVTLENIDAANFYENFSSNFTVRGGDWGPCTVPGPCGNNKLDVETGSNILIENARFHDLRIVPNSGEHFECQIVFGGQNITFRNNTYTNCEYYDIFFQHPTWAGSRFDGSSPKNILIERNTFDVTFNNGQDGRTSAIAFSPRNVPFRDVLIRCNTFLLGAGISVNDDGDGTQYVNFQVIPVTDPSCQP